jgi:hypothetical protein
MKKTTTPQSMTPAPEQSELLSSLMPRGEDPAEMEIRETIRASQAERDRIQFEQPTEPTKD